MTQVNQNSSTLAIAPASLGERADRLARGVNLSNWFWSANKTYSSTDFAALRAMGLTYVRLPVDFSYLYDASSSNRLNASHLATLTAAIQAIQNQGLAVLMEIHSTPQPLSDPAFQTVFEQFWQSLAAHLGKQTNPDLTFLQPLNEPVFDQNPQDWVAVQNRLLQVIRNQAPNHTLIATAAKWQNRELLTQLQPLADRNIIYDFHFYDPFLFTHQGADWVGGVYSQIHDLPYPANSQTVQPLINQLAGNPNAQGAVAYYGSENWSKAKLKALLAPVADWANRNQVEVICSEFGAYGDYAPADARMQYIADVRSALEELGIGWAMWEYMSGFGFAERAETLIVDRALVGALGLTLPSSLANTDKILGTSLANLLVGDFRNNLIEGRGGNDILNGTGDTSGQGTVDTLIGGPGRDQFILGNKNFAFYNDGNDRQNGASDYALIQDFNPAEDRIQLFGDSSRYALRPMAGMGQQSRGIYLDTNGNRRFDSQDELIGVFRGNAALGLTDSCFTYLR